MYKFDLYQKLSLWLIFKNGQHFSILHQKLLLFMRKISSKSDEVEKLVIWELFSQRSGEKTKFFKNGPHLNSPPKISAVYKISSKCDEVDNLVILGLFSHTSDEKMKISKNAVCKISSKSDEVDNLVI